MKVEDYVAMFTDDLDEEFPDVDEKVIKQKDTHYETPSYIVRVAITSNEKYIYQVVNKAYDVVEFENYILALTINMMIDLEKELDKSVNQLNFPPSLVGVNDEGEHGTH